MKNRNFLFPLLTFTTAFLFFICGLAPGVSLQDGGELGAAVANFGVPHPPGYPLFILLGQFFKGFPFGSIAFNLNLMSAFFAAMAAAFVFLVIQEFLEIIGENKSSWLLSIGGALFSVMAPSAYRQSVITEVYTLNSFLCAVLLYLLVRIYKLSREPFTQKQIFYVGLFAFSFGLTLSNHHTSWCFGPLALIFALSFESKLLRNWRAWSLALLFFALGLSLYIYLPWAASKNPLLNWGDPKSLQNFLNHVFRFQYAPHLYRSSQMAIEQVREQIILLTDDFNPLLLFFGFLGLVFCLEKSFPLFVLTLGGLLLTGPITALVTNFEYAFHNRIRYDEAHFLVSVFFVPHHLFWGILISCGAAFVAEKSRLSFQKWIPIAFICFAIAFSIQSLFQESKKQENAAENIYQNWQTWIGDKPALIIANWDPFYFPSLYYQQVEKQGLNFIMVDPELMHTAWYLESLEQQHPELMLQVKSEKDLYIQLMEPFFKGEAKDISAGLAQFQVLLNALIDRAYEKMPVYLALQRSERLLPEGVATSYVVQPEWVLARLTKPGESPAIPAMKDFVFSGFSGPTMKNDFVLRSVATFHVQLILETILRLENQNPGETSRGFDIASTLSQKMGPGRGEDLLKEIESVKLKLAGGSR